MRVIISALLFALIAVLPIWPFDRQWSFGPAIAVTFLLVVNLTVMASERLGRKSH